MTLTLKRDPTQPACELGGGANPLVHPRCLGGNDLNVDVRTCYTPEGKQTTDFVCDFEKFPLPIQSDEWASVIAHFCVEHISWPNTLNFLKEMYRICKPGGKCVVALPNTEAQMQWLKDHPEGWDGKDFFESASEVIFGSADYPENCHKSYWSPSIANNLFQQAGFGNVVVREYGERKTDMLIEAMKFDPIKAFEEGTACNAVGPSGVRCILTKGHTGNHAAEVR